MLCLQQSKMLYNNSFKNIRPFTETELTNLHYYSIAQRPAEQSRKYFSFVLHIHIILLSPFESI